MSREIKFRAWDKVAYKYRGLNGVNDLFSIRSDGDCPDNFILEQYTGLKDKNGVEIYEGDIVKATNPNGEYYGDIEVENLEGVIAVRCEGFCSEYDYTTPQWACADGYIFEVIGNIHEPVGKEKE